MGANPVMNKRRERGGVSRYFEKVVVSGAVFDPNRLGRNASAVVLLFLEGPTIELWRRAIGPVVEQVTQPQEFRAR
jgi:hypothetical protein